MPVPAADTEQPLQISKKPRSFLVHVILVIAVFISVAGIFAFYTLYKNTKDTNNKNGGSPFSKLIGQDTQESTITTAKAGETRVDGVRTYIALGNGEEFLAFYSGEVVKIEGRNITLINKHTGASEKVTIPEDIKMFRVDVSKPETKTEEFTDLSTIRKGDLVTYTVGDKYEYAQTLQVYVGVKK